MPTNETAYHHIYQRVAAAVTREQGVDVSTDTVERIHVHQDPKAYAVATGMSEEVFAAIMAELKEYGVWQEEDKQTTTFALEWLRPDGWWEAGRGWDDRASAEEDAKKQFPPVTRWRVREIASDAPKAEGLPDA